MLQSTINTESNQAGSSLQQAIISLGLEGITLSQESIEDLKLVEAGQISEAELLNRLLSRTK